MDAASPILCPRCGADMAQCFVPTNSTTRVVYASDMKRRGVYLNLGRKWLCRKMRYLRWLIGCVFIPRQSVARARSLPWNTAVPSSGQISAGRQNLSNLVQATVE